MVIANNLDTTERIVLPHRSKTPVMKYKWYDYAIFYGSLLVAGAGLFWLGITVLIFMFGADKYVQ